MRLAAASLLVALFACGHGDSALKEEKAQARRFRDAYETEAQENVRLRARIAELERKECTR